MEVATPRTRCAENGKKSTVFLGLIRNLDKNGLDENHNF